MKIKLPRDTPVDDWIDPVLGLDYVQFLDTCVIHVNIEDSLLLAGYAAGGSS